MNMPLNWPAQVEIIKDTGIGGKFFKAGAKVSVSKQDYLDLLAARKIEAPGKGNK